jgi:lipopolysaccharide transport system ATP-binding protein
MMAAQLHGIEASEINELMPHIEEFAEIGDYIDRPVRTYSSGMQVRLAFSVATAARPDILIVDEALAVGDSYFQHKCSERIRSFREEGTTLLLVSHSPGAIKSLCTRAMMIAGGIMAHDGMPDEVIDHYNALIAKRTDQYHIHIQRVQDGRSMTRSGTGEAKISSADLTVNGVSSRVVPSANPVDIFIQATTKQPLNSLCAGILIRDRFGIDVWGTNTFLHGAELAHQASGKIAQFKFRLPNLYLAPGSYSVSAALHPGQDHLSSNYQWVDRILTFDVIPGSGAACAGLCNLPVEVSAESIG